MNKLRVMIELFKQGFTLEAIGKHFGISKQRVRFMLYHYWDGYKDVNWKDRRSKKKDPIQAEQEKFLQDRKRGTSLKWELSFSDIEWPSRCPYTNVLIDWFAEPKALNAPSIKLKDRKLGYVPGNVQIVTWGAKKMLRKANSGLRSKR